MDWVTILTILIPTIATSVVGVILKKQIDSQNKTIANLQEYIKATDWKDLKSYYDIYKVPAEKEITRQQVIEEYGFTRQEYNELVDDYNELLNYFHTVTKGLNDLHPNLVKDRILTGLPRNAKYFRDIWQDDLQQTDDIQDNR